jgi:hypothetical protein
MVKELAGAFKGTASPTDQDIKQMQELLAWKLTPAQTQKALDWALTWLFARVNNEAQAFNNTMGRKPDSVFDPETYKRMMSKWVPVQQFYAPPEWVTINQPTQQPTQTWLIQWWFTPAIKPWNLRF